MELSYIKFLLVDPVSLANGDAGTATVMVIGALYQGNYRKDDDKRLPMRDRVETLNRNLHEMTHFATRQRSLERQKNVAGTLLCAYCARCGSRFQPDRCSRCDVRFELSAVGGDIPNIPPKVVKYATSHGHKFAKRPPQP